MVTRKRQQVHRIDEEVKFIRRFAGLYGKKKDQSNILSFIKSLQRAIVQKLIGKKSPFADEIRMIQKLLIKKYNSAKGTRKITLDNGDLDEEELARLVSIAKGEDVYPSIRIMKRFIGLEGRRLDRAMLDLFKKQVRKALDDEKVKEEDPYYGKVRSISRELGRLKPGDYFKIESAELSGLAGIIDALSIDNDPYNQYEQPESELHGVATARQLAGRVYDLLPFHSAWCTLIGRPARNFTMMVHGEPGAGKTTFLLMFAKYLAENFGKVLYVSSEEFDSVTLSQKINDLLRPAIPENLHFAQGLGSVDLPLYEFMILDSANDLGLSLYDYQALRSECPEIAFIVVLQHTKNGQYRGGKDWEHSLEIAGKVHNGVIDIYRNRYGAKGSMDFFINQRSDSSSKSPSTFSNNNH